MSFRQKIRNLKDCRDNTSIYDAYYNAPIDERLVYFESRNGRDFTGNIFRLVEELSTGDYGDYRIYVYATEKVLAKVLEFKRNYNLKIDRVMTSPKDAAVALEKAKYIFTDSGIQRKYVKRPEQVFVNTWHGTPLKNMGRDNVSEIPVIGYIQHSMLSADYLLYPNDYMCEKMMKAFMIEKIYPGKILLEGYPRNSIFFDKTHSIELKKALGLEDKEIFIYMPTFRGILSNRDDKKQRDDVETYLSDIDMKLNDNQMLYVKLHAYNESQIDFSKFTHIMPFPKGYEIYEIVNMGDVLITDYSSVFFDFANTSRKIVIFNYDEADYLSYRGVYFPLEDLPFPKVQDVDGLIRELNSPKDYDDSKFIQKFCTYDNPDAAKNICRLVFRGENVSKQCEVSNDNPNILIYAGDLQDGDVTDQLIGLLENADRKRNNFFITFKPGDVNIKENYKRIVDRFPDGVEFLPFRSDLIPTVKEKMDYNRYLHENGKVEFPRPLNCLFKRSFKKQYGMVDFCFVLDFYGLDANVALTFAKSGVDSILWLHKNNVNNTKLGENILKDIYSSFDLIVVDSTDIAEKVLKITQNSAKVEVFRFD
ncbi:CDP-glycerol glycerophosphotransferase family protein [Methanobrevibacter sp.]|uniref:CDP-glycerol glycerophosphotransferase family protein n=1 Tax=Methanobrevibacter sp. TaxID=66852 RepID=UPI00386F4470